ncbi:MAG: cytochrome b/b6 domain-containing protein [Vicinamibacterales bacterium]
MTRGETGFVYEHPWFVRLMHWTNAVALTVMVMSGLQIFMAFPSFGAKIPQQNLIEELPEAVRLGGWLGGALQWHFTFMWIFAGGGILYVLLQVISGHYRTLLFGRADVPGVWPMIRHYLLFKPRPRLTAQYNPLQKLAYTVAIGLGAVLVLSGSVMYKPSQLSTLALLFGGYHRARLVHFIAMAGLLAFIPGHLLMVAVYGWNNLRSMFTGWKAHTLVNQAGEKP